MLGSVSAVDRPAVSGVVPARRRGAPDRARLRTVAPPGVRWIRAPIAAPITIGGAPTRSPSGWGVVVVGVAAFVLTACRASPADTAAVARDSAPPRGNDAAAAIPAAVERALAELATDAWPTVLRAREVLHAHRDAAIPLLVAAVFRDDRAPLQDTFDLIYPGATRFYGHGWIVPYDLDHHGDRAAWILEELTFRDFGFRSGDIIDLADAQRRDARAAVARWWRDTGPAELCVDALVRAIVRGTEREGRDAYGWLGDPAWPCTGFSAGLFRAELLPVIEDHAADPDHPLHGPAVRAVAELDEILARWR
jgi:hypothetical protein